MGWVVGLVGVGTERAGLGGVDEVRRGGMPCVGVGLGGAVGLGSRGQTWVVRWPGSTRRGVGRVVGPDRMDLGREVSREVVGCVGWTRQVWLERNAEDSRVGRAVGM